MVSSVSMIMSLTISPHWFSNYRFTYFAKRPFEPLAYPLPQQFPQILGLHAGQTAVQRTAIDLLRRRAVLMKPSPLHSGMNGRELPLSYPSFVFSKSCVSAVVVCSD